MLVSDKYKLLFVHIPKTGGAAVKKMIKKADPKAYVVGHYHKNLTRDVAERYHDYFKFAIVRNSYQSIASHYRFVVEGVRYEKREWSFDDYLDHITHEWNEPYPDQLNYISDEHGVLVDTIYHYEGGLDEELKDIKLKLNWHQPLERSKSQHYYGQYDWRKVFTDQHAIDRVTEICKKDIEFFGFEMN